MIFEAILRTSRPVFVANHYLFPMAALMWT